MGTREYEALARHHRVPIVITGSEPVDLLEGICRAVRRLEAGLVGVENQYSRVVRAAGNVAAQRLMWSAFEVCDQRWRGIGTIPKSGLRLRWARSARPRWRRGSAISRGKRRRGGCPKKGAEIRLARNPSYFKKGLRTG